MSEATKNPVQVALEQPVFKERVAAAAAVLGVTEEALATTLVETLGADSPENLEHVTFHDLTENVAGAKPAPTRRALDVLKGDGKGKGKSDGGSPTDLIRELKDEARLWHLTEGQPLLCDRGGSEHSAANVRYWRRTRTVPTVCTFADCGKLLQHAKGEVSFEDGATFLTPDGANPTTGRSEGKFSLVDRALAHVLIGQRKLTKDEAWRRLEDASLRTHYAVDAAQIEGEDSSYANLLRKPFHGLRTNSMDPFYRSAQPGHTRY